MKNDKDRNNIEFEKESSVTVRAEEGKDLADQNKKKRDWKTPVMAVIIILLLLLLASRGCANQTASSEKDLYDGTVVENPVPTIVDADLLNKSPEEIQEALNKAAMDSMYTMQIPSAVQMVGKTLTLNAVNPDNNVHNSKVVVIVNDEEIYTSPIIKPGQALTEVEITKEIPDGEHLAKVMFKVYRDSDGAFLGQVGAEVKLIKK